MKVKSSCHCGKDTELELPDKLLDGTDALKLVALEVIASIIILLHKHGSD